MRNLFVVLFVLIYFLGINGRNLPKFITRCKKHDPEMVQCLSKVVEQMRPLLKTNGIPEMHMPPLDPLHLKSTSFDTGNSFEAVFENVDVYGLSNYVLKHINFDFDSKRLDIVADFDDIRVDSDYRVRGKLMFLELDGEGRANVSVKRVGAVIKLAGKIKNIKGKEYIYYDDIDLDLSLIGSSLYFDNIFKNNPEITANTNRIIAENIDTIINEFKPVIQNSFRQIVLRFLKEMMERYTIDDLFADD